ncbi:MAG: NAD(+) kinase [Woeseiaceae bacterium]|nr:NAD(+) kinase [Woeseiaceae bacterium]
MPGEFQKVALVGRDDDSRVVEPMTALASHLTEAGVGVVAVSDMSPHIGIDRVSASKLDAVDLIVAIGGDGTILFASRVAGDHGVPLLGINRGRLGFLADVSPEEMISGVDQVLAGNYTRDSRMQLSATLERADGSTATGVGLNDIVLQRRETGRMVDFETRVGDHYVNTHAGDGLIVATPTGSTAYALSCGGPILEPQLDAIVIVPVCPHTLTDRPIVIRAQQEVVVSVLERAGTRAEITVDGHSLGEIRPDDRLVIRQADTRVTLLHPPNYDFYGILRSKLLWGRDSRVRDIVPKGT